MHPFFRDPRQRSMAVIGTLVVLAACSLGLSA